MFTVFAQIEKNAPVDLSITRFADVFSTRGGPFLSHGKIAFVAEFMIDQFALLDPDESGWKLGGKFMN